MIVRTVEACEAEAGHYNVLFSNETDPVPLRMKIVPLLNYTTVMVRVEDDEAYDDLTDEEKRAYLEEVKAMELEEELPHITEDIDPEP